MGAAGAASLGSSIPVTGPEIQADRIRPRVRESSRLKPLLRKQEQEQEH
jgi:hypothetical protein